MDRKIHWEVCWKIGFDVNEKWYKHEPEKVVENDSWKFLWYVTIQTDYVIEARRPDNGNNRYDQKWASACHFDSRIEEKEKE